MWMRSSVAAGFIVAAVGAGLVLASPDGGGPRGLDVATAPGTPGPSPGSGGAIPAPSLAGTAWHTRSVEGPLFFVIREVGVKFGGDGTFRARVLFVDEQKTERTGTYALEGPDRMTLSIPGLTPQTLRFWKEGPDIMLRDEAHDVTARFVPGPMTDTGWF